MIVSLDSTLSGGLGDAIAFSWLMEAGHSTGQRIKGFTRDPKKRILIDMLGQVHSDDWKHAIDLSPAFEREQKELAARPRWHYWVELLKLDGITPICPPVNIHPSDLQWVAEKLPAPKNLLQRLVGASDRKLVLIFPNASQTIRMWPTGYWMDLTEMLYAAGHFPLVVYAGSDLDDTFRYSLKDCALERIAALMKACALTIAPDSFPAHLAATIGCPTLTLWGPSKPESVFGHCLDRIAIMRVSPDIVPCVGCNSDKKHIRPACGIMCEALAMLQPKVVLAKAVELIRLHRRI
jgi:ADP-heptose:LPS heptosyltransferase